MGKYYRKNMMPGSLTQIYLERIKCFTLRALFEGKIFRIAYRFEV